MKISVDDKELFTLSEVQKQVIKDYVDSDIFEEDMKRRLQWVLTHLYENAFCIMKAEWDIKLAANGVKMMPTNPDEYAQLVFQQPNYKDRKARELEDKGE